MKEFAILLILSRVCSTSIVCPERCTCDQTNLELRCRGANSNQLIELLNSTSVILKHLSLTKTERFSNFWPSICRQSELESLDLSYNGLREIPTRCFVNMSRLKVLIADANEIVSLSEGTFDGLTSIEKISINSNQIENIDTNVFADLKMFANLESIDLNSNNLRSLDSWPLALGGSKNTSISINVAYNFISKLTNRLNYTIPSDVKKCPDYAVLLDLTHNELTHMSHFFEVWYPITSFARVKCGYKAFMYIKITGNKMACDCVDFLLLTFRELVYHSKLFRDVPCRLGTSNDAISDAQMICQVYQDCPDGCRCYQRPFNNTVVVDCSTARLTSFPLKLPSRRTMTYFSKNLLSYDLILTNSLITRLTGDSTPTELKYAVSLDLSGGKLSTIDATFWNLTKKIKTISLHNNSLTTLPKEVMNLSAAATRWSLHDNPWSCSCENAWMRDWILTMDGERLGDVFCYQPEWHRSKNLRTVDFCYAPPFDYGMVFKISIPTAIGAGLVAVVFLLAWHRFRHSIYEKYGIRFMWEADDCRDEGTSHDIFLVCAEQNISYCRRLLDKLERHHGFKVLFHSRDFHAGMGIMENIRHAISVSKRTVCLVSKQFLASSWCVEEFRMAYQNDLDKKKNRLLMILLEPIDWNDLELDVSQEMKNYIERRSYLELFKLSEKSAWRVLLYSLPTPTREGDVPLLVA